MSFSQAFIKRPVATVLVMVSLFLAGCFGYKFLPISALPQVDYPTIQVSTFYPGASPSVMTSLVTAPLEKQFGTMPGLTQMVSSSTSGCSVITLKFSLGLSLDIAEQEVQAAMNAASSFLPTDLPNLPVYHKVNPADPAILTLAITAKNTALHLVQEQVETRLSQKISQVLGVGLVSLNGGKRPGIRIQCNPLALASYGLELDDIKTALTNNHKNQPKGSIDGPYQTFQINSNDQLFTKDDFDDFIVFYKNSNPIYLKSIATIKQDVENTYQSAWYNNQEALILNIQRQPGANVIQVVDNIKKLLPSLTNSFPKDVDISIVTDQTLTIRASIHEAIKDLGYSILLVILVVFVFLKNPSATFIPSIAIPLSIITTFFLMHGLGYSLNNLSIMALTIATGFVVDDAIVMLENIARLMEKGKNRLQASLEGSRQIGFTILSLTFSLIAVLIPLLFMGDIVGRLFKEFSITLSIAILISAFISLTLTPMLCSKLLKSSEVKEDLKTGFMKSLEDLYAKSLMFVFAHQKKTLFSFMLTLVATGLLATFIPKGLFPSQDTGVIQAIVEINESASYNQMLQNQKELASEFLKVKGVENIASYVGVDAVNPSPNSSRFIIALKEESKRASMKKMIASLKKACEKVPGVSVFFQPQQDLSLNDRISKTMYQVSLTAPDETQVSFWAQKLKKELEKHAIFKDVTISEQNNGTQLYVELNRQQASRLGLNAQSVFSTLYSAYGQRQIATMFSQTNQHYIILEVEDKFKNAKQGLENLYFMSSQNTPIALTSVATIHEKPAALSINRLGQFPTTTVSFNLAPHASLGKAIRIVENEKDALEIPKSVQAKFEGTAHLFKTSLSNEGWLILASIVVVYIVLGILYESYIHPVTILSTLPSAGLGALFSLFLLGKELDVVGIIGLVLLIGIVKKNAIMMIDFALDAQRNQNLNAFDAIYQACLLRLRPILMTTMAAILGALPLAFSFGTGSELRQPLGIAIIGGLVVSQILTLYTTPVIYLFFDRVSERFKNFSLTKRPTYES